MTDLEILEWRRVEIKRLNALLKQLIAKGDSLNALIKEQEEASEGFKATIASLKAKVKAYAEEEDAEYQDLFKVTLDCQAENLTLKADYGKAMRMLRSADDVNVNINEQFKRAQSENRELKSLLKSVRVLLEAGQWTHAKEMLS